MGRLWWTRCYECGGHLRKIGYVPPETYRCIDCENIIRMTKENEIKCKNVRMDKRREERSVSKDNYPNSIRPSYKKISGER